MDGILSLTGSSAVEGNTADSGGGIANLGLLSVTTTGFFRQLRRQRRRRHRQRRHPLRDGRSGLFSNSAPDGGAIYNVGGTVTLTDVLISANNASDGGGVYSVGGPLTLTGCAVTANGASDGGGVYNAGGKLTLTSCTFTVNSAGNGNGVPITASAAPRNAGTGGSGGGLFTTGGTATLTDDVFYGDTLSGGGVSEIAGPVSATFCDIQQASGVFPGAGNLNVGPQFTGGGNPFGPSVQPSAASPVLGRGTTNAPNFRATDLFGDPYFSPPAIGAVEGPEDTHVLWTNPNGRTIFWDTNSSGGVIVAGNYPPLVSPSGVGGYVAQAALHRPQRRLPHPVEHARRPRRALGRPARRHPHGLLLRAVLR